MNMAMPAQQVSAVIARARAAAGSAVILNGFGKTEEIEAAQATIKSEFGVAVA